MLSYTYKNHSSVDDLIVNLRRNALLGSLPEDEFARLAVDLDVTRNGKLDCAHEAGGRLEEVYFPLDAVFSVVETLDGSGGVEVMTIGNEGVVGLPLFLEPETCVNTTVCQVPGLSARLSVTKLAELVAGSGALLQLVRRYVQVTIMQLRRNAACNSVHVTRQRASRWLLNIRDRVGRDRFPLTHELFAQILGVRRATVTDTAAALQQDGLIWYRRGQVKVLDRPGLERESCECYRIVRERSHALLHGGTTGSGAVPLDLDGAQWLDMALHSTASLTKE